MLLISCGLLEPLLYPNFPHAWGGDCTDSKKISLTPTAPARQIRESIKGYLAHEKTLPPWGHRGAPGVGLLEGHRGRCFLMSEVPLYMCTPVIVESDPIIRNVYPIGCITGTGKFTDLQPNEHRGTSPIRKRPPP